MSFDFRENVIFNEPLKKIIRPVYHDLPNYFILALDTEEILAEKIRAIVTRYKARDVYD
jgi:predicted nucleotidyltransferase component of viral defense system